MEKVKRTKPKGEKTKAISDDSVKRTKRNEVVGFVVSTKMQKTISVQVFNLVRHDRYGKFIQKSSVFKAHDEKSEASTGDKVKIFESRPYSKTKRWVLGAVLEKKKSVEGVEV